MDEETRSRLVKAVAEAVLARVDALTALDQAIGDGDHGINMKRGFEAVMADLPQLARKPLPDMVKAIGMTLLMKVGGASGPLYGTLLMEFAKTIPEAPTRADAVAAFGRAVEAVKARGKSDLGQKTMLDVLGPVHAALVAGMDAGKIRAAAASAAEATVPMRAIRGRASFLGDRSIGHMDPGACSSALMLTAIVGEMESLG